MDFVPSQQATPIRNPSTANLLIDSIDRPDGQPSSNFTISLNQNILTGFFTRLAMAEVVLDWCVPNISAEGELNTLSITIGTNTQTITVPDGHYTVAKLLPVLVSLLNAAFTTAGTFSVGGGTNGDATLVCTNAYGVNPSKLATALGLVPMITSPTSTQFLIDCPNLLPYSYIDIVCNNLTYCQDLKDATTSKNSRDVIYRWYFAWDGPAPVDASGYQIFQGYQPFNSRRYLSFPKQIKWDNIQPIGQLAFQVYTSADNILDVGTGEMEFRMTLLVSEQ